MLSLFQWIEATSLAMTINNSKYAFALIESFHLLSLAVIGGAVLVVDARLLGLGFRNQRVSEVAAAARPWLIEIDDIELRRIVMRDRRGSPNAPDQKEQEKGVDASRERKRRRESASLCHGPLDSGQRTLVLSFQF